MAPVGMAMPIKAEMRWFYPIDWPQLSRYVRFEHAGSVCQGCGRPHHLARRRITYLSRRALGDLFLGPYST
jgi:ribosomal protein S14